MSLDELRRKLSAVDRQIVDLIAERQRVVGEIGRNKRTEGAATRDYAREKDVLGMGREQAEALGLDPDLAENILRQLITTSLASQERERVIAEGSHLAIALQQLFDSAHHVVSAQRLPAVVTHGGQLLLWHIRLERDERQQLSVPVLLDHEEVWVSLEEPAHGLVERKRSDAHVVGRDAALGQAIDRLSDRPVTAADGDDSDLGARPSQDLGHG